MRTTLNRIILIIMWFAIANLTHAQRKTEIGLTGGGARFYPVVQNMSYNLNNSMDNGWGWSAGIFIEDHWKSRFHQVIELNYYNLSSDVYLQKNPTPPWSPYDGTGRVPVYGDFGNTSFSQIAISGGVKYLMTKSLFLYPAFEIGFSTNPDIDINKTAYSAKLGLGTDIRGVDIILEYNYGLNHQRMVYDPTVPFASTHRNSYLQLKAQVPLHNLRK